MLNWEPDFESKMAIDLRRDAIRLLLRRKMQNLCMVDDKHIPLYRILWISEIPHFCGHEDCAYEDRYEVRLEQEESVWANRDERDDLIETIDNWQGGIGS